MKKRATVASVVATAAPAVTVAKPDEHVRGCNTPSCDKRIGGRWAKKHRKPKTPAVASWYGPGFHGRRASSGATFRQEQFTAASLILPFGTFLKVTHRNRSVIAVVTDRGPYVPGRVLDLSLAAAQAIGLSGVDTVQMEILVPAGASPQFP